MPWRRRCQRTCSFQSHHASGGQKAPQAHSHVLVVSAWVLTSQDACTGAPREDRHLSTEFSAQTSTAFLPPRTVLSATPDRASPVPAHPTHSGSANPRHHTARRGLPRPSRHQVGSQHTGSLGGDECRDLPFYSRITTRKLTQLPIFPADDRFQGRTEQRLGLHCLPRTQEQGPNLPG